MAPITICEHIKENGDTCASPALTGYVFCYFHQRLREPRHRPGDFEYKLPILDTPHAILMATQHITQAALDGILEERRARLVTSSLRLAMTALNAIKKADEETADAETKNAPAVSSRAPLSGEESALAPSTTASASDKLQNVDTGFQARVGAASAAPENKLSHPAVDNSAAAAAPEGSPRRQPWVSVTTTTRAPAGATDKPLSPTQLKLMKKILRRGPSHPRFATAARLLDSHISPGNTA